MTWKEIKDWCAKHQIEIGFNSIRFAQIPETKEFFERRPKWDVFEFSGDSYKNDGSSLMNFERYVWTMTGRKIVKAPIFFYKPTDLSNISDYDVDSFLETGNIPSRFFQSWSSEPVPIYTVDDLEKSLYRIINLFESM